MNATLGLRVTARCTTWVGIVQSVSPDDFHLGRPVLMEKRSMTQGNSRKPSKSRLRFEARPVTSLFELSEELRRIVAYFRQPREAFRAYCNLWEKLLGEQGKLDSDQINEQLSQLAKLASEHEFPFPPSLPPSSPDNENTSKTAPSELAGYLEEYEGPEPPEIVALATYLYFFIDTAKRSRLIRSDIVRNFNSSRRMDSELYEKWSECWQDLGEYRERISVAIGGGVDKWVVKLRSTSPGIWTSELGEEVSRARDLLYEAPIGNEDAELTGLLDSLEARFRTLDTLDFSALQEEGDGEASFGLRSIELADGTLRADVRPDTLEKNRETLPRNPEVMKLVQYLIHELPKGEMSRTELAREFAKGNEIKAQSLLKKIRSFPDVKSLVDKVDPKKNK